MFGQIAQVNYPQCFIKAGSDCAVEEALYDLYTDPQERCNRLDDPRLSRVVNDLRERLTTWMRDTGDPILEGQTPFHEGVIMSANRKPGDPPTPPCASIIENPEPPKVVFPQAFAAALRSSQASEMTPSVAP